LLPLRRYRCC